MLFSAILQRLLRDHRGVAQLVERTVRDREVARSSRATPTNINTTRDRGDREIASQNAGLPPLMKVR